MSSVSSILNQREGQYGPYSKVAWLSQSLKRLTGLISGTSDIRCYHKLSDVQREALEMIISKIARIAVGDPNHVDSWDDIAGYATLAANQTRKDIENAERD